jgi:phosphoenolpyruvate synthase/pyruvate phosphate dikinase
MKVFSEELVEDMPEGQYGGKASNLAKLAGAGVMVPAGFAIAAGELPSRTDLKFLIEKVCGGYPVAVRSSAIGEDSTGQSFAGQYDTFLNVPNLSEVLKAIGKVRMSAKNERVSSYRESFQLDSSGVGVVVQTMLRPYASGVMFTAEPVEGDTSLICIEEVAGLGDKLVSGQASPNMYIVEKATDSVVEETIIEESVIGPEIISQLAKEGKKIEEWFGCPQDIEWAVTYGDSIGRFRPVIQILQTRPVTTLTII